MADSSIQEVVTPVPTDADAPRMYLHSVYIVGGVAALCVIGIIAGMILNRTVDAALAAIGGVAIGKLGELLAPART